jgi:hypothetical protein
MHVTWRFSVTIHGRAYIDYIILHAQLELGQPLTTGIRDPDTPGILLAIEWIRINVKGSAHRLKSSITQLRNLLHLTIQRKKRHALKLKSLAAQLPNPNPLTV